MSEIESGSAALQYQMALSRWDNEGGAGPAGPHRGVVSIVAPSETLRLTNAELGQLGSACTVMLQYAKSLSRPGPRHKRRDGGSNRGVARVRTRLPTHLCSADPPRERGHP
jgi:hypothetical protein